MPILVGITPTYRAIKDDGAAARLRPWVGSVIERSHDSTLAQLSEHRPSIRQISDSSRNSVVRPLLNEDEHSKSKPGEGQQARARDGKANEPEAFSRNSSSF